MNCDDCRRLGRYILAFIYCDVRGSIIHSHWVKLTPGYSSAQARTDADVALGCGRM
ncbi:hypothetical protein V8C43DRAFT_287294 [Trichoderma afarasin]